MEASTDTVMSLVTKHPLSSIGDQSRLSQRLAEAFSDNDKQQFLMGFYMYQNHHKTNDYIIDLEEVYRWLGYAKKETAKDLLIKHFTLDVDYQLLLPVAKKQYVRGGHNKETFMMNIQTFKMLCLKANTKRADDIHKYYLLLEEVILEIKSEEVGELKNQLTIATNEQSAVRERTLIESYDKKRVVYLGSINPELTKYGYTSNIKQRTDTHKREIGSVFTLRYVFECEHNVDLEDKLKHHNDIFSRRCKEEFNGKVQTELIRHDKYLTIDDVGKIVTQLKHTITIDKEYAIMKHEEKMSEELSKQIMAEEQTKLRIAEEATKQKAMELEMKRMEFELEMKRLEMSSQSFTPPPAQQAVVGTNIQVRRKPAKSVTTVDDVVSQNTAEQTNPATADDNIDIDETEADYLGNMVNTCESDKTMITLSSSALHLDFVQFLHTKKVDEDVIAKFTQYKVCARFGVFSKVPSMGIKRIPNFGKTRTSAYQIQFKKLKGFLVKEGLLSDESDDLSSDVK